jgi:hypothetical protein
MRAHLVLLVAGCGSSPTGSHCTTDSNCGTEVCARDGECLPASQVRMVKLTWTIRGSAANPTSCASSPNFYVQFDSSDLNDSFGYEPVPCQQGQFGVDKLPKRYVQAEIGVDQSLLDAQAIDATGMASFDLSP